MAPRKKDPMSQELSRVHEIARQLQELEPRLGKSASTEVEISLLERATELAEEAARLLEHVGRETA